jgi:hypothetical protein
VTRARAQDQSTETSRRKRRSTKVAQTRSIVGASLEVRTALQHTITTCPAHVHR